MNWLAISSRYRTDLGEKPGMNRAVIFIVEEYKTALDIDDTLHEFSHLLVSTPPSNLSSYLLPERQFCIT